ncbi:MAG: sugar phosphate isomerase/epimerase family protein, partial [Armatimonadota bacterium]
LAVENLPPDYLGHTPEEILGLLDDTEPGSVSVCFDCGHANLSGRFIEFARALLPRSSVTHVHDNDGTSDQHRLPGAGVIDWRSFAEVWLACRCSPAIVLECQSPAPLIWSEAFQVLRKALG